MMNLDDRRDLTQPAVVITAIGSLVVFALTFGLDPVLLTASIIVASQPLLLAAIGEMVVEKSGVLNLGVEGMMITGAICGFAISVETGSPLLGLAAAAGGAALLSLIFGFLTQVLLSNQVATGLALTMFGLGLSALIGHPYSGVKPPQFPRVDFVHLEAVPIEIMGESYNMVAFASILNQDLLVYLALALTVLVWLFLGRSRGGMILRAVGENHNAAHSLGYNVIAIRMAAIAFGGACAGLGGAYLSLVRVPQWTEGMTAGAGWIALAIVVFGAWKPWRVLLGAYLFGGVTILQLNLQAARITPLWLITFGLLIFAVFYTMRSRHDRRLGRGPIIIGLWMVALISGVIASEYPIAIQSQYLSMTPYIVTIIVLVVMSSDKLRANLNAPASLGRVFHKSA